MLLVLAVAGLVSLGYAVFRLGRGSALKNPWVLFTGIVGLVSVLVLGILAPFIVGGGCYLLGKSSVAAGGRRIVLALSGSTILGLPVLLMGLFYLASQAA